MEIEVLLSVFQTLADEPTALQFVIFLSNTHVILNSEYLFVSRESVFLTCQNASFRCECSLFTCENASFTCESCPLSCECSSLSCEWSVFGRESESWCRVKARGLPANQRLSLLKRKKHESKFYFHPSSFILHPSQRVACEFVIRAVLDDLQV